MTLMMTLTMALTMICIENEPVLVRDPRTKC